MGLLDRLFGKPEPPIADADRLRQELFAAARVGDRRRLERLARANEAAVLAQFPAWQKVPEDVRADPAAVGPYVESMIAVAELFAQRLGRPELMAALTGPPGENPLVRWQETLQRARELMNDLRYDEARPLLSDALIDARGQSGTGVDRYLPITHGYLGEAYFESGRAADAIPHLQHALAACERTGDAEGIAVYLNSLFEVHRYLGHAADAAGYADRLVGVSKPTDADRWRKRAQIVRAGEPRNRVVAVVNGVTMELDEVRPTSQMRVQFVFDRNRISLRPAVVWTERGEKLATAGRFEEALAAFRQAADADQFDPHSRYLAALTLMHLERFAEAAELYEKVEELAPGWFNCRADAWVAARLAAGQLEPEDFKLLLSLEDGPGSPKEKAALAERLLARHPDLPAAHLHRGRILAQLGRESDARAALEMGLLTDADPDVRTRLLTELAAVTDDRPARVALYRQAAELNGHLVAAAGARLALRS